MQWQHDGVISSDCVVIYKVHEAWGGLSNMANDFPLKVGGIAIGSSEALYQALRFPHRPEWQREILEASHAMQAKMKSKKEGRRQHGSRADWAEVQQPIMRWVLRVKLACHPREFGRLLRASRGQMIVERSRSDRFWGAVPEADGVLRGENRLGQLLMELREELQTRGVEAMLRVPPPDLPDCLLLERPLGEVVGSGAI